MGQNYQRLKMTVLTAMFAAVTGILAQVEIPLPYVPISGQTLAVGLTATILGSRYGAISMIVYAAIGGIGLPVFAGANAGLGVLTGPTGGYILGFIFAAFIMGFVLEKIGFTYLRAMIANVIGMVIILAAGAVQLKLVSALSWGDAFAFGVYPFIVVGLIKAGLASWLGITIRRRLVSAKLLQTGTRQSNAA